MVIVAALLTLAPWAVRNSVVFHTFVPLGTETGYALGGTYNDSARTDPREPGLWRAPFAAMLSLHQEPAPERGRHL